MLAHFTRTGNRDTPLNAAISPIFRASCGVGLSFPVTSSWNWVKSRSTSARDLPFTAWVMIDAAARDTAHPVAVNRTSSIASRWTFSSTATSSPQSGFRPSARLVAPSSDP